MRLYVVSEYYWPDEASTGRLLGELMERLTKDNRDLRVTVLTTDRLYRVSQDYKLPATESRGNVEVIRLKSHRTKNDRFIKRLWSDIVFSLQAARHLVSAEYDCLFMVTNPPLMPLMLSFASKLRRKPFLYLIHDLYPDVTVALGIWSKSSVMVRLLRLIQRHCLRTASRIVVLGRCMRDYLTERYSISGESITVISNWHTVEQAQSGGYVEPRVRDTFDVVYSGNLGQFQDFETLLDAAEHLKNHGHIQFYIVGDGYRKSFLEQEVARRSLTNVILQDFLPQEDFRKLLEGASLGLVTLEPELEGIGVPSKTYNLLAMGIPLLAILGERSEVAHVIKEAECGHRFDHGDATQIACTVLELYQHPEKLRRLSQHALQFAKDHTSLSVVADQYMNVIRECLETER